MAATKVSNHPALYFGAALISLAAYSGSPLAEEIKIVLVGTEEVPPVQTSASGSGTITVNPDKTVSGGVKTSGLAGTAAHIHQGAAGANGGVIITLVKTGDDGWAVPPGAKLTDAQYNAYKAGDLYVNVHSAANKGGELRAQIKP